MRHAARICIILAVAASAAAQTPAPRTRAYWQGIVDSGYAVPEGESAGALLVELSHHLGSLDPVLRDDFGYSIAAAWIYRDQALTPEEQRALLALWTGNLRQGVGERRSDRVFLRSFSALNLSILAAHDNRKPFLEKAEFDRLLDQGLAYLAEEKDLRDWADQRGWIHATAHTADLLKFLARSRHLQPPQQRRVLDAVSAKMRAADRGFSHGEDQRLARALLSLARRDDADSDAFAAWAQGLAGLAEGLWKTKPFDHGRYVAVQNTRHLLESLHLLLASEEKPTAARQEIAAAVLVAASKL